MPRLVLGQSCGVGKWPDKDFLMVRCVVEDQSIRRTELLTHSGYLLSKASRNQWQIICSDRLSLQKLKCQVAKQTAIKMLNNYNNDT